MKIQSATALVLLLAVSLSACSRNASIDPGPDEFAILPTAGLVEPANYSDLPAPGQTSRAALNPIAAASIALGGSGSVSVGSSGDELKGMRGLFGRLFGGGAANAELLNPNAEAARLQAASVAVVRLN